MVEKLLFRGLKLCSGKGSFEAIPQQRHRLDLTKLKDIIEGRGNIVLDARVMLIVQCEPEVTVLRDGRLLIKTRDEDEAQAKVDELRPFLEECL